MMNIITVLLYNCYTYKHQNNTIIPCARCFAKDVEGDAHDKGIVHFSFLWHHFSTTKQKYTKHLKFEKTIISISN